MYSRHVRSTQKEQNYIIKWPFGVDGTRMSRGNTARFYDMESKFESPLMESITEHEIMLANTFTTVGNLQERRPNKLHFWEQDEMQLQKWPTIDYIAVPN